MESTRLLASYFGDYALALVPANTGVAALLFRKVQQSFQFVESCTLDRLPSREWSYMDLTSSEHSEEISKVNSLLQRHCAPVNQPVSSVRIQIESALPEMLHPSKVKNIGVLANAITGSITQNFYSSSSPSSLAQSQKIGSMRSPPNDFSGRGDELKALEQLCQDNKCVAISGLGGIGKTAIALRYISQSGKRYKWVHFISGGSMHLLKEGLRELADDLKIPQYNSIDDRISALWTQLSKEENSYLILFDGVDSYEVFNEIQRGASRGIYCLLLTTCLGNKARASNFRLYELNCFSREESTEYLMKVTGIKEEKEARLLAEILGDLPLALKQAAYYIKESRITFQDYLNLFKTNNLKLFEPNVNLPPEEKTILTIWHISLERIEKTHNCLLSRSVLVFFSFLGQSGIPLSLIEKWHKASAMEENSDYNLLLVNSLKHLSSYSLIDGKVSTYHIHPLVQRVIQFHLTLEDKKRHFCSAIKVAEGYKEKDLVSYSERQDIEKQKIIDHFLSLLSNMAKIGKLEDFDIQYIKSIFYLVWLFYTNSASYKEALKTAQQFLEFCEMTKQPEKVMQHCHHLLGWSYEKTKNIDEAIKSLEAAWALQQRILQEISSKDSLEDNEDGVIIDIIATLNTLGSIYVSFQKKGPLSPFELFSKALEVREKYLKRLHPFLFKTYHNLGMMKIQKGQKSEGVKDLLMAYTLKKSVLEEDHLDVSSTARALGQHFCDIGNFEKGLPFFKEALSILLQTRGNCHPETADCWSKVGWAQFNLADYRIALKSHENHYSAIKGYLKKNGLNDNVSVGVALKNIGSSLCALGDANEGIKKLHEALKLLSSLNDEAGSECEELIGSIKADLCLLGVKI